MADVKIALNTPIYDGMPITFKAPCACTEVTKLQVQYLSETGKAETTYYIIVDSHGVSVAGLGNLFAKGAYVRVILDTRTHRAYLQNADSNSYIEGKIEALENGAVTTDAQEHAQLGPELANENNWMSGEWLGDLAGGFTHESGAGDGALSFTIPGGTKGKKFQISFNSSVAMTTDNLFVRVGGSPLFNLYGQADPISVGILAPDDGDVEFIPSVNFAGTLTNISIRQIISGYDGCYHITNSVGDNAFAIRGGKASSLDSQNGENNLFMGKDSGQWNTSGYGNVAVGSETMGNNLSGFWNVGVGYKALGNNTAGSRNIGIGYVALLNNEVGHRNIAIGTHTLRERKNGNFNIAIGADSQLAGSTGDSNVSIGHGTMYHAAGNYNVAIGEGAIAGSQAGGSNCNNNVAIGHDCMQQVTGADNVAIGRNAAYNLTSGSDNVFLGVGAGKNAYGAKRSLVIGASSGQNITNGSDCNIIIGNYTGNNITSGVQNITIGASLNDNAPYSSYWLRIGHLLEGYNYPGAANASMRYLIVSGGLQLPAIPTADPGVAGRVWNDNGTLKVSAG